MINIFREMDKKKQPVQTPLWKQAQQETMTVSEYILSRLMLVSDDIRNADVDALGYLEMLFFRVRDDTRIPAQTRSLMHILDKLNEDLEYSVEIFGQRAAYILDFLEADTLKHAVDKSANEPERLILGRILRLRNLYIQTEEEKSGTAYKPREIKEYLDRFVIGQRDAKLAVSTAVYGHGKRVRHPEERFAPDVVLLIGPSGCGKTEIMRRIREITDYPMVFTDVSSLGASQYRGRHKEDILLELYEVSGRKKNLAEKGIVFMDEFDKLMLPAVSERGVNVHDDVQSQLLTMLEGAEVELKCDGQQLLLDTSRMLFVLAGAFQGLDEYIRTDKREKSNIPGGIGFKAVLEKDMNLDFIRDNINHEVLMKYGMKRELAGRISSIAVLEKLDIDDMIRILTEPEDSLVQRYERELKLSSGGELIFTDDALNAIAEEALKSAVGARALQSVLGRVLGKVMYKAPGIKGLKRVIINEAVVKDGEEPLMEVEGQDVPGIYM
ncbi:MAG: AAA family ATPase [Lachnospiraceae bacterium]|nr:AAA family ATPase [Lachnospiraceae bacterium]